LWREIKSGLKVKSARWFIWHISWRANLNLFLF